MKKYFILTSVLALTACATGGGSGGGNPGEIVTPSNYVDRVAQSNANITGMISNSEYQVAKYVANKLGDDAESVNLSRTATVRSAFQPSNPKSGNIDYDTAHELVELAAWLVNETTTEKDIADMFNESTLNKNKIKAALKLMDDMYCFVGGSAEETAHRIKESDFEEQLSDLQQKTEVFDIENAKFFDTSMNSEDEYVSFGTDTNGQIDKMMYHWNEGGSDKTESVDRNGPNTNIFTEHVYKYKVEVASGTYYTDSLPIGQYTKQQIKNAFADAYEGEFSGSVFDEINNKIDSTDMQPIEYVHNNVIDLQGKNLPDSHKLRYSDFGYTTILAKEISEPGDGDGDDNTVIFGGYPDKEIEKLDTWKNLTFSGKAVAALGDVHGNGNTTISTDNTATTLIIDKNGKETLTMPFNDWYTVKVEKPQGESYTISWDGTTNIDYALDSSKSVDNKAFNIKYYGGASVPSEAVGGIGFQNNGVEFNGAFGVKAQ